ncbi:hypothetical protein [Piscirickettsia salmonis]|uniref:hypothetical protein n=1 Tax=Piscirickettsia salmonis TaxID=1238 RepID=UPI0007C94626
MPHYDTELERKPAYLKKAAENEVKSAIALEDNVTAHYIGGKLLKVISEVVGKRAWQVTDKGEEKLVVREL